jgi:glucose-6-phosphate 1-dehydrogenase
MEMQAKTPGQKLVSGPVMLTLDNDEQQGRGPEPYQRLLADALRGDQALFARQDGVDEAWRIVDPVLSGPPTAHPYRPGSWGPEATRSLRPTAGSWATGPDHG